MPRRAERLVGGRPPWRTAWPATVCILGAAGCAPLVPPEGERCVERGGRIACTYEETTFELGDRERTVLWQVPLGEAPAAGWPAVIVFQGSMVPPVFSWQATRGEPFGGWHQAELTRTLLEGGFAVITPAALGDGLTCWNTNLPPWAEDWEGSPDDQLMVALLAAMEGGDFGPLDPTRRFATGISSGGYMTSRMAVSYPGRFGALAIDAASYATCLGFVCDVPDTLPSDHPPTRFFHGGLDPIVPLRTMLDYADGLERAGIPVDRVVDPWAGHAWLEEAPESILDWFQHWDAG